MATAGDILNYWFEGLSDTVRLERNSPTVKKWFTKSEAIDREIREKFEADLLQAAEGKYQSWEKEPKNALALVILFDQFSRNMYRGTAKMFSFDENALRLTLGAVKKENDKELPLFQRIFLYMPLMHAEDLKIQELSLKHFGGLVGESKQKSPVNVPYYTYTLDYARRHHEIIAEFGRFPHRNKILTRVSTPQEEDFLKNKHSSF